MSEREIIDRITQDNPWQKNGDLLAGIGDDCAVYKPTGNLLQLLTCDSLMESIHFDLSWHPPELLGEKAVSVNVSDIAAMGGVPKYAVLALGLSKDCHRWLDRFLEGFTKRLAQYQVKLVGGDTVNSKGGFMATVTLTGEVDEDLICYRSGAREGDIIWVSGSLGEAAAGLEICLNNPFLKDSYPNLVRAHLSPDPHPELGSLLARSGFIHAMIDISDGLATDLGHICQASELGAEVYQEDIPLSGELVNLSRRLDVSEFNLALKGGEDYQLLFTTSSENQEDVLKLASESNNILYPVGRMVKGSGVTLCAGENRSDITYQGYEHR